MPYAEVDRIAKMIPADLKMTVKDALKAEPRFREMIDANPRSPISSASRARSKGAAATRGPTLRR